MHARGRPQVSRTPRARELRRPKGTLRCPKHRRWLYVRRRGNAMKWECVVVESNGDAQWEVVDATGRREKRSGHGIRWEGHPSESVENFLNRYGAAGWELVA